MHSAIIVVTIPGSSHAGIPNHKWNSFIADIDDLRREKPNPLDRREGVERLAENVWLVNFQESPESFARIVYHAKENEFSYKILPLADAPQWLPVASDPRPS